MSLTSLCDPPDSPDAEFRVYACPRCQRLWVLVVSARPIDPVAHDHYLHRNLLGLIHFAGRPKSWDVCNVKPQAVARPDVLAAYHLGGAEAVDAMSGRK
jgi:hypothetical protein